MLQGFKVVELSTHIAAPGAGGMLADWGADVIKVEGPEGDPIRRGFEHLTPDKENPGFQLDNRGSGFRGKQFQAGLLGRLGELEVRDQVQGAEWLASQNRSGAWDFREIFDQL